MVFVVLMILALPLVAPADDMDAFLIKKKYYQSRLEAYFANIQEKDRQEEKRLSGITERKAARLKQKVEAEQARKEYLRFRKAQTSPPSTEWEAEQRARERQRDLYRKEYAERRKTLNDIIRNSDRIPELEELEIDTYYFEEWLGSDFSRSSNGMPAKLWICLSVYHKSKSIKNIIGNAITT